MIWFSAAYLTYLATYNIKKFILPFLFSSSISSNLHIRNPLTRRKVSTRSGLFVKTVFATLVVSWKKNTWREHTFCVYKYLLLKVPTRPLFGSQLLYETLISTFRVWKYRVLNSRQLQLPPSIAHLYSRACCRKLFWI